MSAKKKFVLHDKAVYCGKTPMTILTGKTIQTYSDQLLAFMYLPVDCDLNAGLQPS